MKMNLDDLPEDLKKAITQFLMNDPSKMESVISEIGCDADLNGNSLLFYALITAMRGDKSDSLVWILSKGADPTNLGPNNDKHTAMTELVLHSNSMSDERVLEIGASLCAYGADPFNEEIKRFIDDCYSYSKEAVKKTEDLFMSLKPIYESRELNRVSVSGQMKKTRSQI